MATPEAAEHHPIPAPGTYEMEPAATTIRFETRAMFGLLPVRGTLALGHGRISVAESVEESSVEVAVRADSFDSGLPKRDEHVMSPDYLDAAGHPEIVFRSVGLDRTAAGDTLQGELTVRGATAPVTLTLDEVSLDGPRVTARGTATVDRYAVGITKAKGMTGRHIGITVDVVANR